MVIIENIQITLDHSRRDSFPRVGAVTGAGISRRPSALDEIMAALPQIAAKVQDAIRAKAGSPSCCDGPVMVEKAAPGWDNGLSDDEAQALAFLRGFGPEWLKALIANVREAFESGAQPGSIGIAVLTKDEALMLDQARKQKQAPKPETPTAETNGAPPA